MLSAFSSDRVARGFYSARKVFRESAKKTAEA
jgi:hypothetical protein